MTLTPCTNRHCGFISHGGDGRYHPDHWQRLDASMWGAGMDPATGYRPDDADPPMTREEYLRGWLWDSPPIDLCPYWRSPEPRRALAEAGWPVSPFPAHWTREERANVQLPESFSDRVRRLLR